MLPAAFLRPFEARGAIPGAGRGLARVRRRTREHPILVPQRDQPREREEAAARMDLRCQRRSRELRARGQSHRGPRGPVRHDRQPQRHRAQRRHRRAAVALRPLQRPERAGWWRPDPRRDVLERRPGGGRADLRRRAPVPLRPGCEDRAPCRHLRQRRAHRHAGRPPARREADGGARDARSRLQRLTHHRQSHGREPPDAAGRCARL